MEEVVVYIWFKNSDSWGHVAIQVDDVYISWWPTESKSKNELKKKKYEGRVKDNLPCDYKDEEENFTGRPWDRVFHISLNLLKIKEWWSEKIKTGYHFLRYNCCDVAVEALRAGGATIPDQRLPRTPAGMADICEELTK